MLPIQKSYSKILKTNVNSCLLRKTSSVLKKIINIIDISNSRTGQSIECTIYPSIIPQHLCTHKSYNKIINYKLRHTHTYTPYYFLLPLSQACPQLPVIQVNFSFLVSMVHFQTQQCILSLRAQFPRKQKANKTISLPIHQHIQFSLSGKNLNHIILTLTRAKLKNEIGFYHYTFKNP